MNATELIEMQLASLRDARTAAAFAIGVASNPPDSARYRPDVLSAARRARAQLRELLIGIDQRIEVLEGLRDDLARAKK